MTAVFTDEFPSMGAPGSLEEKMRAFILAGLFLGSGALMACSSDPPSSGSGGEGGEDGSSSSNPTTSTSTGSSTGSGGQGGAGGGQGGAGEGGAGQGGAGQGGGASAGTAEHLGDLCGAMQPCPTGYACAVMTMDATSGFCTPKCSGQLDTKTCSDGFGGPGQGICNLTLKDAMNTSFSACGIACGDQWMPALPTTCPAGLTCKDLIGTEMKPDGKTDLCVP